MPSPSDSSAAESISRLLLASAELLASVPTLTFTSDFRGEVPAEGGLTPRSTGRFGGGGC